MWIVIRSLDAWERSRFNSPPGHAAAEEIAISTGNQRNGTEEKLNHELLTSTLI